MRHEPGQGNNVVKNNISRLFIAALTLMGIINVADAQRFSSGNGQVNLAALKLPPGFKISLYASNITNARSMALSPSGTLFVGTQLAGQVYALLDTDQDGRADKTHIVAKGLNTPNGVAFHDGDLYVAELNRILRFDDIENHLEQPPQPVVIYDQLPSDTLHGWKYISFGPDGKLYVPVGAPCNTCEPSDRHALIARIDADGSNYEVFARGIRNTVGFAWHPETGEMWFTDNGRDLWGDDRPPEELNRVPRAGLHFGFPYHYGKDLTDPDFSTDKPDTAFTPPVLEFPAHTAGLGVQFYTGDKFPAEFKNDIFIAYHGSWNRSKRAGYYLMRIDMENNQPVGTEVFASGWLQDEKYWGRPVDLEMMADGSLLLSDDFAGAIYRITYQN